MEQKYVLGIVALSIVAVLGVSMVSAFGFGNGIMNSDLTEEEIQEQKEVMKATLEDGGDYEAWKSLMDERIAKMQVKINEDTFNEHVERHEQRAEFRIAIEELKASEDFSREDVQNLKEEYGIEGKGFEMKGKGKRLGGKCPFEQ